MHICTTKSLSAGIEQIDIKCPICGERLTLTWIGEYCSDYEEKK